MDINKIVKQMTREEFMNSDYIIETDNEGDFACYKCVKYEMEINNIKNLACEKGIPFSCEQCWENAIKDIKFKGEDCMEFDWEGFKNNRIAVHCATEEKAKDFLKECEKQGLEWFDGKATSRFYYYDGICYVYKYDGNDYIQYSGEKFYLNSGYEIIEWEIENKIDYDREYNIMEIMEFPEGIEFRVGNCMYRIKNGELEYNDELDWRDNLLSLKHTLTLKFKLVKKDKKVSFMEAMKAFDSGKTIKVEYENFTDNKKSIDVFEPFEIEGYYCLDNNDVITPYQILNGEWYIKED